MSVTLNLGEGSRLTGGKQRLHYEIAHGSAREVKAGIDLARAWGYVTDDRPIMTVLDRQLALLWKLTGGRMARSQAPSTMRAAG